MFCAWLFPFIFIYIWKDIHYMFLLILNTRFMKRLVLLKIYLKHTTWFSFTFHKNNINWNKKFTVHEEIKTHNISNVKKKTLSFITLSSPFYKRIKLWSAKKLSFVFWVQNLCMLFFLIMFWWILNCFEIMAKNYNIF